MPGFDGKPLHDRLFAGLEALFGGWAAFRLAKEGEWGGHLTSQKAEWFVETMADYLFDGPKSIVFSYH